MCPMLTISVGHRKLCWKLNYFWSERQYKMQVFISYRLRQVDRVRPIVDFIRASGIAVWFNEYNILLHNNHLFDEDKVGQHEVKVHLASAVKAGCTHAVLFSNNEWASSEYCNVEAEAILGHIAHANIVQVHIPEEEGPRVKYPELHAAIKSGVPPRPVKRAGIGVCGGRHGQGHR